MLKNRKNRSSFIYRNREYIWASILVVLIMVFIVIQGYIEYERIKKDNLKETNNLTTLLEQKISGDFRDIDSILSYGEFIYRSLLEEDKSFAKADARKQGEIVSKRLKYLADIHNGVEGVNFIDRDGNIFFSSNRLEEQINVADREHFQVLKNSSISRSFSRAITARTTGKRSLAHLKAIRDKNGELIGIISALTNLDRIDSLISSVEVGELGVALLRRSDTFMLLSRHPKYSESDFNKALPLDNPIVQKIKSGYKVGDLSYVASTDGGVRLGTFKLLEGYPFYVQVALAKSEYLSSWMLSAKIVGFFSLLLPFGALIVARRVKESRESENRAIEELKKNEELLSNILANTQDVIYSVKLPQSDLLFLSPSVERIYGYTQEEFSKNTTLWFEVIPLSDKEIASSAKEKLFKDGFSEAEHRITRKNGSEVWIQNKNRLFFDKDGNPSRIDGIVRDITEQKLQSKTLEESRVKAEAANRAKSDFLANMSHEIRTPMNAIIGLGEMLGEMDLEPKQKDFINKINSSSKMLLGIINDILDYSKIEAGKLELEYHPFSLNHIISQLWVMFEDKIKQKGLKLTIEKDSNIPNTLVGDELRITQVVANLLSNAIKFTKKGEVSLFIGLKERIGEKKVILSFSLKDSGIGMSKEQIEKLFTPFTQADSSTTRKYGGTGLGLVISKRIIEAMGGDISIQSAEGKGTTVDIDLMMEEGSLESKDKQKDERKESKREKTLKNLTILLVEDNEINQQIESMMLQNANAEVIVASDGREGVEKYKEYQNKIDIILMDLQMPVMSGYDAALSIREFDKDVPIIALTAAAMLEDREKAMKYGMNEHLSKPINKDTLYETILGLNDKREENLIREENPIKTEKQKEYSILDIEYLQELGDRAFTMKILKSFLFELQERYMHIFDSQKNDDEIKRILHACKGAAGNIGAYALSNAAQNIESILKNQEMIKEEYIASYKRVAKETKERIEEELKEVKKVKREKQKYTKKEHKVIIENIKNELKSGGLIDQNSKENLLDSLEDRTDKKILDELERSIDRFDYDNALEIIEKIEEKGQNG